MEIPITQFRQRIFELMDRALEGKEVWVRHKGRRVRIVPEHAQSKLSRVTPMQIVAPGADLKDESWKAELAREWEGKWDHKLGSTSEPARKPAARVSGKARKSGLPS